MSRSTRMLVLLAIVASLCLAVLPTFADAWDATAQYSKTANPNGTWAYGFSPVAAYSFTAYTATLDWGDYAAMHAWQSDDAPNTQVNWSDESGLWWGRFPGIPILTAYNAAYYSIIRWTVPANGTYTVKALFRAGEWSSLYGHACDVHVRKNNANIWDGQTGTFVPLRFEPYAGYYSVMTLNAGDTIDFIGHSGENANADIAADIKIASGSYVVSGHVQDASGAALSGVKVAVAGLAFAGEPVTGATSTYAVTDASGNYSFSLFDGNYTLAATKSPYTESDQPLSVSGPGSYTVNFTLTPTGVWNAKGDFSLAGNPNGNWSYGYATHNAEPMNTTGFQLHTNVDSYGYDGMYWAWWVWANSTVCWPGNLWGTPTYPYLGVDFGTNNNFEMRPTGSLNNDTVSILRWTAPSAGLYSFVGQFLNTMGAHTYGYSIVKNKTTVLVNNNALSGFAPNNVGPFNGYGSFAAGETLDFVAKTGDADDNRNYLIFDGTVKSGAPGVTGYVEDVNHVRLANATVVASIGTEQFNVTTAADGTYTIVMHSGTFSVDAIKAGYKHDPLAPKSVVVTNSLITTNFTLPFGNVISGKVTENIPPAYPTIAGASVSTTDGVYSTTSDSAGNYSIQVTPGTYGLTIYKLGHLVKTINVDASAGNVTQDVRLDVGFDFAYDFGNGNPTGAWSYGYATGTVYKQSPDSFKYMDSTSHWVSNPNIDGMWYKGGADTFFPWGGDPGSERPVFDKNLSFGAIDVTSMPIGVLWYGGAGYREARKVVANQSSTGNVCTVARFTAPTSGYFHITTRFAGVKQIAPYTLSKVALMYGNNYIFGGPSDVKAIAGFAGRSVNGYADSAGSNPVYTYSFDKDIAFGDKLDAIVLNDTTMPRYQTNGWTQVDVTIVKDATTLTGRVISTLAGNPPVAGATVIANGWVTGVTYQTTTDINGYYVISARPDTYDMEARGAGYNTSPTLNATVAQDGVAVTNFQLTHSGTWNLANDFSPMSNPSGQWSYGYYNNTAAGGENPAFQFVPLGGYGSIINTPGLTGWYGTPTWNSGWTVWVAKNTSGQAIPKVQNYYDCYVEANHISMGGGDGYTGGPAIRWTAPDNRLVQISLTVAGQATAGMTADLSLFHNMTFSGEKTASGFIGTAAAGLTDNIAPGGVSTYQTTVSVASGDTFDFVMGHPGDIWVHWWPMSGWPFKSMDIFLTIGAPPANTHQAASIADIKALSQGDTVIMTTPVQLGCTTLGAQSFDKSYGNPTPGPGTYSFYVQNADRSQGIKCITDGTVPTYDTSFKITFTGVVDTQLGQKVVKIQSINSAVGGAMTKPIGKTGKSLAAANNGVLVKVWGKITQMVANTGSDNDRWQYEYIVINDGSQDVKIPMHTQANYMAGDSGIVNLAIGHMVAITGIAGTTTGSDLVVSPRNVYDIYDYTDMGRM